MGNKCRKCGIPTKRKFCINCCLEFIERLAFIVYLLVAALLIYVVILVLLGGAK